MALSMRDEGMPGLAGAVLRAWRSRGAARRPRALRLVESLALGGRKHVHLVACGDRMFVVGTGADAVHCVMPVDEAYEAGSAVKE